MNIAMFTDCYKPVINGVTTSVVNLKTELETLGHSVYVFAPRVPGHKDTESGIYRFFSIPYFFQKEHRISFPFPEKNLDQIRELNIELIHIHSPFFVGFWGLTSASRNKLPVIFSHHTLWEKYTHYFPLFTEHWREKTAIKLCQYFAKKSKYIIAPTKQIKELLEKQGTKTPIYIIPSGIKLNDLKSADPEKFKKRFPAAADKKILVCVGRLGKEKNIDFLLTAFKRISDSVPVSHFLLVGDGPYRRELEEKVSSLELSQKITFTGYVSPEEVKDYLKASYIFIFASLTETQGIVLQEAMGVGVPIVAISAPGADDTITTGEDGFLIRKDDIKDFAEKTIELLENTNLRDKMSQKALEKAESFSQEKLAEKIVELYRRAALVNR